MEDTRCIGVWTALLLCGTLALSVHDAGGEIHSHPTTRAFHFQKQAEPLLSKHNSSSFNIRKRDVPRSYKRLMQLVKRKPSSKSSLHNFKERSTRDTRIENTVENSYPFSEEKIDSYNFTMKDASNKLTDRIEEGATHKPISVIEIAEQLGQVMQQIAEDDLGISRLKVGNLCDL